MPITGLDRTPTLPEPLTDVTDVADWWVDTLEAQNEAARTYLSAQALGPGPRDYLADVIRDGWRVTSDRLALIRRQQYVRDTGMDAEGGVFAYGPVGSHWPMSAVVEDDRDRDEMVTLFLPPTIVDRGTYPATDDREAMPYEYLNLPYVGRHTGPTVDLYTRADDRDEDETTNLYVCACESHYGEADHPSVAVVASAYDAGGGCDTDHPCQECWEDETGSGYVSVTVPQSIARFVLSWWPTED